MTVKQEKRNSSFKTGDDSEIGKEEFYV